MPAFQQSQARLAHGWRLAASPAIPKRLIDEFIRPAVRAVPSEMASQIGVCRLSLVPDLDGSNLSSQWTNIGQQTEISLAVAGRDGHEVALEMLACLGQALWEKLTTDQLKSYWQLLYAEFQAGIDGEIDDEAFAKKRTLLRNHFSARSKRRLQRYTRTSFSETAAEYVHCLWHDVNVISGSEHLPAQQLQRRLQLFSCWFPPDRGYTLYSCAR